MGKNTVQRSRDAQLQFQVVLSLLCEPRQYATVNDGLQNISSFTRFARLVSGRANAAFQRCGEA
jgi:hypothetical protein